MQHIKKISVFVFIVLGLITKITAQINEVDVKAAYIHQLTQNIEWQDEEYIEIFHFGLLTSDKVLIQKMNEIADNYKLRDKPLAIEQTQINESFLGYHMIFVDETYCNELPKITDRIKDKNILIISFECEEPLFIMINLLRIEQNKTISYEINVENLEEAGFKFSPDLLVHGGSLIDLKELYKRTANQLEKYNQRLKSLEHELNLIEKERIKYQHQVDSLNRNIDNLHEDIKNKALEYNKLITEIAVKDTQLVKSSQQIEKQAQQSQYLKTELYQQLEAIKNSREKLNKLNVEYLEKQKRIALLQDSINQKQSIINVQVDKITSQRKLLLMSIALALALLISLGAIYNSFRLKKQMASKLQVLVEQRTRELLISKQYFQRLIENSPVVLIELDITDVIAILETKEQNNVLYNQQQNIKQDVVKECLTNLHVVDFNRLTYTFFETEDNKDILDHFSSVFPRQNNTFLSEGLKSLIKKEETYENEAELITFKGKIKNTLINWVVLNDKEGVKNRVLLSALDITTLKRFEKELKIHHDNLEDLVKERTLELNTQKIELEKALDQLQQTQKQLVNAEKMASLGMLTAGVAHEINNPINFISGGYQGLQLYSEMLKKHFESLENAGVSEIKQTELIKTITHDIKENDIFNNMSTLLHSIEDGVERTTRIVNSLNSYSYDSKENLENYQITEAIENALTILENKLKHKVKVVKKYNAKGLVECNPGKINQVFLNIISNAVDAIEDMGDITILTESQTNTIKVSITDSGLGMDSETMNHVFDPFFTTKTVGKGTGLGMYISYGIIQQHGGDITVESTLDTGTTFTVVLPVKA